MTSVGAQIQKHHLGSEGGVYRTLSLYTLSCVGYAYTRGMQSLAGMSYGPIAAYGDKRGWQSLLNMSLLVKRISRKISNDRKWLTLTRKKAQQQLRTFETEYTQITKKRKTNPASFMRWLHEEYPKYLSCLGLYNACWRYADSATQNMPNFSGSQLRAIGKERDQAARLYPRVEAELARTAIQLGKDLGVPGFLFLLLTREDLKNILHKKNIPSAVLQRVKIRRHGYAYICIQGKELITTNAFQLKKIKRQMSVPLKKEAVIHGKSAYPGKVLGVVVMKPSKQNTANKHKIFITHMTHPSHFPFLKTCSAIVTDEGGILSHAAIAARELKKPCIIGTKHGTKVVKEGNIVEVDATHGIMKIISKT